MADSGNTLDIVIRMLAEGDGAKVTARQIEEIKALEEEQAAASASPEQQRKLENTRAVLAAVQQITPEIEKSAQAGKSLADQMAEVREKSEKAAAARVNEMVDAQDAAVAKAAQEAGRERAKQAEKEAEAIANAAEAAKEDTSATAKQTDGKRELGEALKSLSLAFPGVAQLIRALTSPIGLAVAAVTLMIAKVAEFITKSDEAAAAARQLEDMGSGIDPLGSIHANMRADETSFAASFANIAQSANGLTQQLNQLNAALLLQQRLAQAIDDARLDETLAKIQAALAAGQITGAAANTQTAAAQREARDRKTARELDTLNQQAAMQRAAAAAAEIEAGQKASEARELGPVIAAQTKRAQQAGEDKSKGAGLQAEIDKLGEMKAFIEEALTHGLGIQDLGKALKVQFGKDYDWTLKSVEDLNTRITALKQQQANYETAATQEAAKLKTLTERESKLKSDAVAAETTRVAALQEAARLESERAARLKAQETIQQSLSGADAARDAAAKSETARQEAIRRKEIELETVRQRMIGSPDDPRLQRRRSALENELDALRNFQPESRALEQERERTRTMETEERIRRQQQEQFLRDNGGGVSARTPDAGGVVSAAAEIAGGLERYDATTRKALAGVASRLAGLERGMDDLATRVATSRAS